MQGIQAQVDQHSSPPPLPSVSFTSDDTDCNDKENRPSLSSIRVEIEIISPKRQIPNKMSKTTRGTQVITESPFKKELEKKLDDAKKKNVLKATIKRKINKIAKKDGKKKKSNEKESWLCKLCGENREENMI